MVRREWLLGFRDLVFRVYGYMGTLLTTDWID